MSCNVFKTIDILKKNGYLKEVAYTGEFGTYKDKFLKINACNGFNFTMGSPYFGTDSVSVTGVYNSGRTLTYIDFEMPSEFESERKGLVWFLVTLERQLGKREWKSYCSYKAPPIKIVKTDYFIFPWVINRKDERREHILKLKKIVDTFHFYISREELSRLRKLISQNSTDSEDEVEAKVFFDGETVTWKTDNFKYAGVATGIKWENPITVSYSNKWGFPPKFWGYNHFLSFSEEGLFVDYDLNSEVKISGNTVGQVDVFETKMLSYLLKFAYFYPKYDGEVDATFNEQDFREWIEKELGHEFDPYMDCLAAMVRVSPIYKDDINVFVLETVIDVFKSFPKGTETRIIYKTLEKKIITVDQLLFNRVMAGWKCWCNDDTSEERKEVENNNRLFNPTIWKKGYRLGTECIVNGVDSLREWTKVMLDRCGIEIGHWLGSIWETIRAFDNEDVDADVITSVFELVGKLMEMNTNYTVEKIYEMLIEATGDEDKVKKFRPYIEAAFIGLKEFRSPTDITYVINETIEAICKDNKQDADESGKQKNHIEGNCEAKLMSMTDTVRRFEEVNENRRTLPLNEDSTPESLQLLDKLIKEDKKANPEKYEQREREYRERSEKSYNANVLRNEFRKACSLTEMIDKIKVYGTEEYSPFYDNNRSRFLWEYENRGKQGDAETQYEVGCIYEHGWWGVTVNFEKAREWYEKAGEQGKVEAQLRLANMYEYGWPFKKDLKKAIYWYQKAAETGDAAAQCVLADIYENGWWGTIPNENKAYEWYLKAAEQGYAHAQKKLGSMCGKSQEAALWYEKAALKGNKRAQHSLAWLYERGYGVEQDYVKAFDWYMKSALQGYIYGYLSVGLMYYEGKGVQKDYKQAVDWFRKAAEKGLAEGQYHLGVMYLNGWGVKKDLDWASHWFYLAADNGHEDAKYCSQNMWQKRIHEETLAKKHNDDDLANEDEKE